MQTVSVCAVKWLCYTILTGCWVETIITIKTKDGKIGSVVIDPFRHPKETVDLTKEYFKEFFSKKSEKSLRKGDKQYPWREISLPEEYVNFLLKNGQYLPRW